MQVCPDCKSKLVDWRCDPCGAQFEAKDGIPNLLSRAERFVSARQIGSTYDEIYSNRTQVWQDQGRTPQFIEFFAKLAAERSTGKILEIGCGEGFLLAALQAKEKYAIDISKQALAKTKARTNATCSVALAERLPFPNESFDLVLSVGVMEHFLDDREASAEIRRVLKPGGSYLVLIHVFSTFGQRFMQKVREYILPPRPVQLLRWVMSKAKSPIHQPIQRGYTVASAQACLEGAGLRVERMISTATERDTPLIGPHVVIFVTRK